MRRRAFITLLGGAAVAWPLAARAQQGERMRRIGVMMNLAAEDAETRARVAALRQGLQELGWSEGRNLRVDYRWGPGDREHYRKQAAELVALTPDVIVASTAETAGPLQQATRSVPIVFVWVIDPVGVGLVESLSRPEGNITGFTSFEYGVAGKWLELLKSVAPEIKQVAVIRDPTTPAASGQLGAVQAVAPSFNVELRLIDVREPAAIERGMTTFARASGSGVIVLASSLAWVHRELITTLAARLRLPAVYPFRPFVTEGGLISYGPNATDQYRRAPGYVDRILKGEKPANLPVQAPTKYALVINLKTAKALGLEVPPSLLARSDEVIE